MYIYIHTHTYVYIYITNICISCKWSLRLSVWGVDNVNNNNHFLLTRQQGKIQEIVVTRMTFLPWLWSCPYPLPSILNVVLQPPLKEVGSYYSVLVWLYHNINVAETLQGALSICLKILKVYPSNIQLLCFILFQPQWIIIILLFSSPEFWEVSFWFFKGSRERSRLVYLSHLLESFAGGSVRW